MKKPDKRMFAFIIAALMLMFSISAFAEGGPKGGAGGGQQQEGPAVYKIGD